jgi:hypothetical protein
VSRPCPYCPAGRGTVMVKMSPSRKPRRDPGSIASINICPARVCASTRFVWPSRAITFPSTVPWSGWLSLTSAMDYEGTSTVTSCPCIPSTS